MFAGITVTVEREAPPDQRTGDPTGDPTTHPLENVGFDPGGSRETDALGNQVTTTPTLYSRDHDADVVARDKVLVPGDPTPWFVDGDPGRWANPHSSRKAGCVIKLTRTRG